MEYLTAAEIYKRLIDSDILQATGNITMNFHGIRIVIRSTDTIGNNIQEWFMQWLAVNDIYHRPPSNTQNFPDCYLQKVHDRGLLEVKAYLANRRPAFDVANFDSYWKSLRAASWRLDADYLIFAYHLADGALSIRKIYLKKVWQITGPAKDSPLGIQCKNGQLYNIRPNSFDSARSQLPVFTCREQFLAALYLTVLRRTDQSEAANEWLAEVCEHYRQFSGVDILPMTKNYIENYLKYQRTVQIPLSISF